MDLMKAEISPAHFVIVWVVHVPVLVLPSSVSGSQIMDPELLRIPSAASAPRLVRKLPAKDGGLIDVATDERLDVRLKSGL